MATLEDLQYVAVAMRTDVREGIEKILDRLEHPKPGTGPAPGAGGGGTGGAGGPSWFNQFEGALAKVAKTASQAQASLGAFAGTFEKVIGSLGGGMAKFVALADPGAVFRFNQAMENAMSALGRAFAPALERVAAMVQALGNAIESLSPQTKQLIAGLAMGAGLAGAFAALASAVSMVVGVLGGPISLLVALGSAILGVAATSESGKAVMESFGAILQILGGYFETVAAQLLPIVEDLLPPLVSALGAVMEAFGAIAELMMGIIGPVIKEVLVPILQALAWVVTQVAKAITAVVNTIRSLFGMEEPKQKREYDPNKNTATAARQATIGDLRGLANRAYVSAFNTGTTTADRHLAEARRHSGYLSEIAENTRRRDNRIWGKDKGTAVGVAGGPEETVEHMGRVLR